MARQQKSAEREKAVTPPVELKKPLFDRVAGYLDSTDWHYDSVHDKNYFDLRARIRDTHVRVILDVFETEEWQRVLSLAIYPVFVPEARRQATLEAINRINFQMIYGSFEMDMEDGQVRVRTIVEAERDLPDPMIERAMHSSIETSNRYFAPLMAVAFGSADPAKVLDLVPRADSTTVQ